MTDLAGSLRKVKKLYQMWGDSRGSADAAEAWLDLMADDVEVFSLGAGAPGIEFTRGGRGRAVAERYLSDLRENWEMVEYEIDEYVAEGDRIVSIGRCAFRNRHTRKVARTPKVDVYRFRDGRVVEFREYYDTAGLLEAAR